MTNPRPRTGDKRRAQQPLKIDRLPADVREAIQYLKNTRGKTWQEIEEQSALPYSQKWATDFGGFVNWEALPLDVLELYPDMKLPHTNLHRWYDLRISQVQAEVQARSVQARVIAKAFAKSVVTGGDSAVLNAARDQIMSILSEDASEKGRMSAAKALIVLAEVMQEARLNDIKERQVKVDERKIEIVEAREKIARQRLEDETQRAAAKVADGQFNIDDINRIRSQVFGMPPLPVSNG
jgi:hypothetical protein